MMSGYAKLFLSSGVSRPQHKIPRSNDGDIDPLLSQQRQGLIAVSCIAAVSLLATFSLLCFLTYRFIFWKKYYQHSLGRNHYVVLVYNLALADAQQCLGFMISLRWLDKNAVHAADPFCFLQGVWLQIGDPMSGLFVLVIAMYTALRVMRDYQVSHRLFVTVVVSLWVFGILLFIIPIAVLGRWAWLPAVAWCWIAPGHLALWVWTHYFWIFLTQFLTIPLYMALFIQVRRRIAECANLGGRRDSLRNMNRVASYMVIYPIIYTVLTVPLAAGRMASLSGNTPSITYFCVAGSLMTLSGLCDTVLYTLARKQSVLDSERRRSSSTASDLLGSVRENGVRNNWRPTFDEEAICGPRTASHVGEPTVEADLPDNIVQIHY